MLGHFEFLFRSKILLCEKFSFNGVKCAEMMSCLCLVCRTAHLIGLETVQQYLLAMT